MTRHRLDLFSLLLGVLSVAAAAAWLVLDQGYADVEDLLWAAPAALVLAGLAGLAASVRGAVGRHDRTPPTQ